MMGKLIWLMGPSGSGKDSLLAELRLREQTQLLVAHRYITRDASAGSENHIALSEQEFFTRAGQNLLALSWHANGLYYGVGVEIDLWLHAGFDVCNQVNHLIPTRVLVKGGEITCKILK